MRGALCRQDDGFTLAEVAVATAVLAIALTAVMSGATAAVVATVRSRDRSVATWLASERLEQLKSLRWAFEGEPAVTATSDTTTDLSAFPSSGGGTGLSISPSASLTTSVPALVDYLDRQGVWVGNGATAPAAAAFVRRWRVSRLPGSTDALALEAVVSRLGVDRTAAPRLRADDVRFFTIVARKAR
jgi:prepilin-type N-terminal cleavage/methylation domain-containing protein